MFNFKKLLGIGLIFLMTFSGFAAFQSNQFTTNTAGAQLNGNVFTNISTSYHPGDITRFGAVGNINPTTATTTSGSATVTVGTTNSYFPGGWVCIIGAGLSGSGNTNYHG